MNKEVWIFEGVKLAAQLCGAMAAAWLTVRWALSRYKREQVWTRRLASYTEALTALATMQRTLSEWLEAELLNLNISEAYRTEQMSKYREAKRRLIEIGIVAKVILPLTSSRVIAKTIEDYDRVRDPDHFLQGVFEEQLMIIDQAIADLSADARRALGEIWLN